MQLSRPKGEAANALPPFENPRGIQLGKEPITIKAGLLMSISDNPEEVGVSQNTTQLSSVDNQALLAPLSLLSCLKKFYNEAKMASSEASGAPEEFSTLNAQATNMKVKKLLMIADNIRSDETVDITATKAT